MSRLTPFSIPLPRYWTKVFSQPFHTEGHRNSERFGSRTRCFGLEEKYAREYNDALHPFACTFLGNQLCYSDMAMSYIKGYML